MAIPFVDLRAQHNAIREELDTAINNVIQGSSFALGPKVEAFEKEFATYCNVSHCIGVNSGTAALTLLLQAYGIGPGDEAITVANTFFATVEAILHVGATPVLVDSEEDTALINPKGIASVVTKKTKAIIPVHLYGQVAEMDEVNAIAKEHGILVIEDACQAHGALYKDRKAGSLGHAAAWSFYPGKNLGAMGEAGAVTTNDTEITARIRMLRDHGQSRKYEHDVCGWNERMDGIQGAVLSVKLRYLDSWNEKRRHLASLYKKLLPSSVIPIAEAPNRTNVVHLFIVRVQRRDAIQKALAERSIATGIHYPIPIHLLTAMESYGWKEGDFPIAEKLSEEILSLPMFPEMTEEQVKEVCTALSGALPSPHGRG